MKKIFCILSVLTILSPAFADDPAPTPVAGDPGATTSGAPEATNSPKYALMNANASTDGNAASAGYVKGAYNAAIKAVNKLSTSKQEQISVSAGSTSGPVVKSIALNNDNKTIGVTLGQVTIPVGSSSATNQAGIWVE